MSLSPDKPLTRVVRVITRLNVGGPSIQAATLSSRLVAQGFETMLIHGRLGVGEGDMCYLLDDNVQVDVRYVPTLQRRIAPASDSRAFAQIFGLLRRFRPAIVHTHMAKAGTLGRLAALAYNRTSGRHSPARLVHTYHGHVLEGYFDPGSTGLFVRTERLLARATDVIVAISPGVRHDLAHTYRIGDDKQYRVVPLGFDLAPFAAIDDVARYAARAALQIPDGTVVVTTVGRLTAIKQHHLFLEMAARISQQRRDVLFLIAGGGELRGELEASARHLGIADRVRFLGWRRDLPVIYGATDVFALTSRNEGTPVALIESLAAGVPGVSTDVGGVRDVLGGEGSGLLVPPGNAAALVAAVCTLLDAPERRRQLGARGRRVVLTRYHVDRLVHDISQIYRELLAR